MFSPFFPSPPFENLVSSYGSETLVQAECDSHEFENLVSSYGSETVILFALALITFENLVSSYGSETLLTWSIANAKFENLVSSYSDIARTWLLLKYGEMRNVDRKTSLVVSIVKACVRGLYLRETCRLSHITRKEVKQWIVPVAAARLSEWLTDNERSKLLALVKKNTD